MLFNSFEFLAAFLPITLLIYFILLKTKLYRASRMFLLAASLFFYGYSNVKFLLLIIVSIVVNYSVGVLEIKSNSQSLRKFILIFGIAFNILLLGYFKYYNFTLSNVNRLLGMNYNLKNIILPVGISFFTFQQLSYIIDCYRKELNGCSFFDYGLLVSFFPKILSGPLVSNKDFFAQLQEEKNRNISFNNLSVGLYLLAMGLGKKVILADYLAVIANKGFNGSAALNFMQGWTTSLSYTLQLYFDFSGYCDMAFGIALMFNIVLPQNFDSPYKAKSIKEFWNRWHITLGSFLTKYVYIPLGGNRKGIVKTCRNLFITFFISGLWHGSGWNFILWGMMHGTAMIVHRLTTGKGLKMNKYIAWLITFIFVNAAWVFFRATDVNAAFVVLKAMVIPDSSIFSILSYVNPIWLLLLILFSCLKLKNSNLRAEGFKPNVYTAAFTVACIVIAMINLNKNSNFVYFSF